MAGIIGALIPREPKWENQWYPEPQNDTIKGGKQPTSKGIQQQKITTKSLRKLRQKLKESKEILLSIPKTATIEHTWI